MLFQIILYAKIWWVFEFVKEDTSSLLAFLFLPEEFMHLSSFTFLGSHLQRVPALCKIHVNWTGRSPLLMRKSPTCAYINQKSWQWDPRGGPPVYMSGSPTAVQMEPDQQQHLFKHHFQAPPMLSASKSLVGFIYTFWYSFSSTSSILE